MPLLGALPHNWSTLSITVPSWLTTNRWWYVFFYALSQAQSEYHGGSTLTVDGVSGYAAVLITTGPAIGAGRPVSPWTGDGDWSYYVDDAGNRDMDTSFDTPTSTAYARDRLYTL